MKKILLTLIFGTLFIAGGCVVVPPRAVLPPPPKVWVPVPRVVWAPPRAKVWVPGHWNRRGRWVPGHYRRW